MLNSVDYGGKEADVVRALEEDIIFGQLAPGTRLAEDALLSRFAVSRHTIRRALYQLEELGIVTRERNKARWCGASCPTRSGRSTRCANCFSARPRC